MSWTDNQSIKVIKYFRDKFKVKTFIETGTFMGINSELHSTNFKQVITTELVFKYYLKARKRLKRYSNIDCYSLSSPTFLKHIKNKLNNSIIYLDAHFYSEKLPKGKGKFVILKELKALKNTKNCIIIIHDFSNGLGHITYDDIPLDLELIKKDLFKVNPNFYLYTNELSTCNIVENTRKEIIKAGLRQDTETFDNLRYAWSKPRLTYRGILYCLPNKLSKKELKELGLRKWT